MNGTAKRNVRTDKKEGNVENCAGRKFVDAINGGEMTLEGMYLNNFWPSKCQFLRKR
jgi:hypothetical protein